MPDYGEIMCQAIDEIVTQKMQGLQYDITKVCTIVDDSERDKGKYVVTDGAARYEAYSTTINYREGNSVYVIIPNGNYNLQKTIIGKYVEANTQPFVYTPPLDTMIEVEVESFNFDTGTNILLANGTNPNPGTPTATVLHCGTIEQSFVGYDRLGISADFQAWLAPMDTISGSYGLRIYLYTNEASTVEEPSEARQRVYELTFSNMDMYGNPYNFETYFSQEKVFDISDINHIYKIEIYAFQNGEFLDGNGNHIPHTDGLGNLLPDNIFIDNLKFYLGYSSESFTDDTLILYTEDSLTYSNKLADAEKNVKHIELRWIHKQEDGTFKLVKESDFPNENLEVRWYKYRHGAAAADAYSGVYWDRVIPGKNFEYDLYPDITLQQEQIKVIGFIKNGDQLTPYYSNLLIFTNESTVANQTTIDVTTALSIMFDDGTFGNYFIYDQNGKLIDTAQGQKHERKLHVLFKGAELSKDQGIQSITWVIPTSSTMMILDEAYYTNTQTEDIVEYTSKMFKRIRRGGNNLFDDDGNLIVRQSYAIKNFWSSDYSSNIVQCIVEIDNVEYVATADLRFGKAGTTGTDVTFLIDFDNNINALNLDGLVSGTVYETINDVNKEQLRDNASQDLALSSYNDAAATVSAHLYDAAGIPINISGYPILWSWRDDVDPSPKYMNIVPTNTNDQVQIELVSGLNAVPANNYHILQATLQNWGNGYNLIAYLPIPIKKSDDYSFITGCKEVIYNSQGAPSYYKGAYRVYGPNAEAYEAAQWQLQPTAPSLQEGWYYPKLQQTRQGPALQVLKFYIEDLNKNICVSAKIGNEVVWSQPIFVTQNQYDFAMLNSWDGSLQIDENNGTILSAMVGAGKKNTDNTFSGVLMGDIQGGTENLQEPLTGLYGFDHGVMSYGFKEDGTAFLGKSGKGRIVFDGNGGTIQSANYNFNQDSGDGMQIDLENGAINAFNFKLNSNMVRIQSKEAPYFQVRNPNNQFTGDVSNTTSLILVGNNNFIIQSKDLGSKFDLSTGVLKVSAPSGSVTLQPRSPYFQVTNPQNKNLIFMGDNNYYLQSADYTYSATPSGGKGMQINLGTGAITGYDLFLTGFNKGDSRYAAIFDTSANTNTGAISTSYPFTIGMPGSNGLRPFRINWEGILFCSDVRVGNISLKAVANAAERAVNIADNFYVSGNGGIGGSSANFSSGSFGSGSFGGCGFGGGGNMTGKVNGWYFDPGGNWIKDPANRMVSLSGIIEVSNWKLQVTETIKQIQADIRSLKSHKHNSWVPNFTGTNLKPMPTWDTRQTSTPI